MHFQKFSEVTQLQDTFEDITASNVINHLADPQEQVEISLDEVEIGQAPF